MYIGIVGVRHGGDVNDLGLKIWIKKHNIFFILLLIFVGTSASTINLDTKAAKRGKVEQNRPNGTPLAQMSTKTGEGTSHVDSEICITIITVFPSISSLSDCMISKFIFFSKPEKIISLNLSPKIKHLC